MCVCSAVVGGGLLLSGVYEAGVCAYASSVSGDMSEDEKRMIVRNEERGCSMCKSGM